MALRAGMVGLLRQRRHTALAAGDVVNVHEHSPKARPLLETLTLPPLAASCRFVFGHNGAVWGLTTDQAVVTDAREHGYHVNGYSRGRDLPHEYEIRLAVPEPEPEPDA